MSKILTDSQIYELFGIPGVDKYDDKKRFKTPFPLYLAWNKNIWIDSFFVHEKIYEATALAFSNIMDCYSDEWISELNINEFGGCYNYRTMRGSSKKLSRHSWAIAIDLLPTKNLLSWKKDKASFANSDYDNLMYAFYDAGFINYGKEKGYDFMHFEIYKP